MERLEFSQMKQSQHAIGVSARQQERMDRSAARGARSKFGIAQKLLAKIGGCVQQKPNRKRGRNRNLCLSARLTLQHTSPQAAAVRTSAIPLRETAAGGGAENLNTH